jgi:trk system potassium uptake protein TrkA
MNIVIVGVGKLGAKVCESLISGNYDITLIDTNEDLLNRMSMQFDVYTLCGDARDLNLLNSIDIGSFDCAIVSTGSDEANIIIGKSCKRLGCRIVIARLREPEYMKNYEFIRACFDIDYIVNPDSAITNEIYKYLAEKYTLYNGIFTSGDIAMIEFQARKMPELVGIPMPDVKEIIPDMLVAAISRNGKIIIPHGGDVIEKHDFIYLVGEKEKIMPLKEKVFTKEKYTNIQKVMIIGGGKTGYYLAEKLANFGVSVKLVEKDKKRCQYLSTRIPNVMILHGDGTDISMLEEENIGEMDAFVTVTGFDEQNLLLALTAKQKGIEDVISKVSRERYLNMIENMGVDMVLNPLDITAGNIFSIIQSGQRVISSFIIQGQAEIVEVIASSGMMMLGGTLNDLELPEGLMIAAIYRDGKVIIPDGDTIIKENDRVLIMTLLTEIADLEKLLKRR